MNGITRCLRAVALAVALGFVSGACRDDPTDDARGDAVAILLEFDTLHLAVGADSVRFVGRLVDVNLTPIPAPLDWRAENEGVVSIIGPGTLEDFEVGDAILLRAVAAGSTTLVASSGSIAASAFVIVE